MGKHSVNPAIIMTLHDGKVGKYASDICIGGTDIMREMCLGAHIPQGNTYHCNTSLGTRLSV